MLLSISAVRLRCFGERLGSCGSSGAFCQCCLFVVIIAYGVCRCSVVFDCISIWGVGFLDLVWPRGMHYVRRITDVACGPVLVFVSVWRRVKCIVFFVGRRGCLRQLRICVSGCSLLVSRLYKPFARKPWLNGLPRACTFLDRHFIDLMPGTFALPQVDIL